jgi:hypothetical protein
LDESRFCKLRNELNIIDFSNVAWKLAHVTYGSSMFSLFFSGFLRDFEPFMSFHDFTRFIFEFLL